MGPETFRYRAVDTDGIIREGRMNSSSAAAVAEALYRDGRTPLDVRISARSSGTRIFSFDVGSLVRQSRTRVPPRDLLTLTQSLSVLLTAGLTIDRALQIGGAIGNKPAAKRLNESLLKQIRAGKTLSAAFAESGQILPPYFRSMVEAGEAGGALPQTLSRLVELQQRQLEVKERVRSALVYPALLAGVVLLTLTMLLTFVLPRFEGLFAESEQKLPWATTAVLSFGRLVADDWWVGVLIGVVGGVAIHQWLRSAVGRRQFDRWLLKTRITFGLPKALNAARFLRTVSTLGQNGLPLPTALRIARGTLSNRCLDDAIADVIADVQAGVKLSRALARTKLFPEIAVQLARVGEESGQLESLLLSSASTLENDCQVKLERMLTLLVPALTIGMGLIVAGLISSVLIGLLSVNDLAF